jgi:hypothetical protein
MRRHANVLLLAGLLASSLLLGPVPRGSTSSVRGQLLEYRLEVINDTGQTVSIRIESNDPSLSVDTRGSLAHGESRVVNIPGGLFGRATIYAYSPTGRLVAWKRALIGGPGLLHVPRGNDGAVIQVTTLFRRAD